MIKTYTFDYNLGDAKVSFKVDTSIFTKELAQATLDFFTWDAGYDEDEDPIDEVMRKYAIEAIRIATMNWCGVEGVISEFKNKEGYASIDGSMGIQLESIRSYEFDENEMSVSIEV